MKNQKSYSNRPAHESDVSRNRRGKGSKPNRGRGNGDMLSSRDFQEKVQRLDKLMKLAIPPVPKAPSGFTLIRKEGEAPGTLEQVGHEADAAWRGVKRIMELLNVEEKYVDIYSSTNVNYTGVLIDLAGSITQGVGRGQRTGDSIKITRIQVRFRVANQGSQTDVQVVLGRSKDALPALSDIFALSGATSASGGLSFENWYEAPANPIMRRDIDMSAQVGIATGDKALMFRDYEHKCDHHVIFSPASTTSLSGATWIAAISGLNASVPVLNYSVRVHYVDN